MVETPCGCQLQCYRNISLEQRIKLFDGFWASGSFDVQNAYICGYVKIDHKSSPLLKMRWINVDKEHPLQFCYRYTHNELEAWKVVNVKRASKGRPPDVEKLKLPLLYASLRKIRKQS